MAALSLGILCEGIVSPLAPIAGEDEAERMMTKRITKDLRRYIE
jgi:hypothetical protein